jgi:hypothetical protein
MIENFRSVVPTRPRTTLSLMYSFFFLNPILKDRIAHKFSADFINGIVIMLSGKYRKHMAF